MLQTFCCGPEALEYVKMRLKQGHALAKHLAQLPLEGGSVSVSLPRGTSESARRQLNVGGIASSSVTDLATAAFVQRFLENSGGRYAVFEDALARPSDPYLHDIDVDYLVAANEVFYSINASAADEPRIVRIIRRARSHMLVGVLSVLSPEIEFKNRGSIDPLIFRQLAMNAHHILVDAYDGEAILVWSRG